MTAEQTRRQGKRSLKKINGLGIVKLVCKLKNSLHTFSFSGRSDNNLGGYNANEHEAKIVPRMYEIPGDNDYFDKNNYFKYAFEFLHMMFLFG